ncbi:TPA: hypothetical protein ACS72K_001611 [Providencia alcalifaciens]
MTQFRPSCLSDGRWIISAGGLDKMGRFVVDLVDEKHERNSIINPLMMHLLNAECAINHYASL